MSLAAAQIISDITDPGRASLLSSFSSLVPQTEGLFFRGDIDALTYWPVMPSLDPSRYWDSAFSLIDPSDLVLGIGDADQPATAGTWDGSYSSDTSGLSNLAYNIAATVLATALNSNAAITSDGGVTVTQASPIAWRVLWNDVGVRADLIQGNPSGLTPDSNVFVYRDQVGSSTVQEVQIIQIVQRPLVYVNSWTSTPAAGVSIVTLADGSGTSLASFSITLSPAPYGGSFQVTTSDGIGLIPWNTDADTFAASLPGTWSCNQISPVQWVITRSTTGTQICTVDVTALLVYRGFIGTLGFNSSALITRFLTLSGTTFTTTQEIRYVDGTTIISVLLHVDVTLSKDILFTASIAPVVWDQFYLTAAQAYAAFGRPVLSGDIGTVNDYIDVDISALDITSPTCVEATVILPSSGSDGIAVTGVYITSPTSVRVKLASPALVDGYKVSVSVK